MYIVFLTGIQKLLFTRLAMIDNTNSPVEIFFREKILTFSSYTRYLIRTRINGDSEYNNNNNNNNNNNK